MNKKIVVVFITCIMVFLIMVVCGKNIIFKDDISVSSNNVAVQNDEDNEPEKITIYDIEEGYLTVPYNKLANKHDYDWSKLENVNGIYRYEDENYTSKLGIDVSSYQGDINWQKVKESGVEFAILRLGYRGYGQTGKIVLDSKFEQNYKSAKAVGIEVGVYFFSQAINVQEVKEEADFVLKHIEGKELSYPVVFDLEKIKNDVARTDNLTTEEITDMTLEFCKIIEQNGYSPSIYGNAKTLITKMKLELFNSYRKWYADYQENPLYPFEFDLWQYTEKGNIDGIKGNVDIDIQFIKK